MLMLSYANAKVPSNQLMTSCLRWLTGEGEGGEGDQK